MKALLYAADDLYQRCIYERPKPGFRNRLIQQIPRPDFREKAERFSRDGILVLPAYFSDGLLQGLREEFERWITGREADETGRRGLNESKGVQLKNSPTLSRAAVDPFLTALAAYYWGKPVLLSMFSGYRLDATNDSREVGPFQWHHDANRKQVKVLVYLDDVAPDGQRMDYLPGTHKIWHRFRRGKEGYEETRFSDQAVAQYGPPVRCAGPAGTVLVFDTNGLHRGNRNPSAKRDIWVFQYTAGRHRETLSGIHPDVLRNLEPFQKQTLRSFTKPTSGLLSKRGAAIIAVQ